MTDKERITEVVRFAGLSTRAFALEIGLKTPQNLYDILNGKHGISKSIASAITAKYSNINPAWLLTGEGSMIKGEEDEMPASTVGEEKKNEVKWLRGLVDYFRDRCCNQEEQLARLEEMIEAMRRELEEERAKRR